MEHHMLERDATLEHPRIAGQDRNGNALYTNTGQLQTSALDCCRHRNALLLLHWQTLEHLTMATASQLERASPLPSRVMSLIHKLFQLYGWGGPLEPCVVRHVPQMHWLPRNTAETDGTKHGESWCIQPYYYLRVTFPCDLQPFIHFSPNKRWSLAGRSSSSIWNTACCIWKGQVETDALSCFSRMALLMHNFRHSSADAQFRTQLCWRTISDTQLCWRTISDTWLCWRTISDTQLCWRTVWVAWLCWCTISTKWLCWRTISAT